MIKKKGSQYQVVSKKGDKNLGTYKTKKEAKERIKDVEYFKHLKGKMNKKG